MKEGQKYLVAFLIVAAVALAVGVTYYYLSPVFPPQTPPGPEQEVTVKTDVKVTRSWLGSTYIESIQNQVLSRPYYEYSAGVAILPFKGTIVLTVVYPSGDKVTVGSQKIVVELGSSVTVTFFWKTRQAGDHVVTATLYDENGVLVDQKSVTFYVPPR